MALLSASHAAYCANSTDTRPNAVAEAGQRAASIAQHPDAAFFACLRQRWLDFQCLHGQYDSELARTASLQPQFTYIHTDDHGMSHVVATIFSKSTSTFPLTDACHSGRS